MSEGDHGDDGDDEANMATHTHRHWRTHTHSLTHWYRGGNHTHTRKYTDTQSGSILDGI